ncbi:hypothetical protein NL676_034100 [Syzygium grande]|nr:hypothetical protein NL676_034100 [Syzygium grande]
MAFAPLKLCDPAPLALAIRLALHLPFTRLKLSIGDPLARLELVSPYTSKSIKLKPNPNVWPNASQHQTKTKCIYVADWLFCPNRITTDRLAHNWINHSIIKQNRKMPDRMEP